MGTPAVRGAFLVALAVLLGFLILNFGADLEPTIGVATQAEPVATAEPDVDLDVTPDPVNTEAVPVDEPAPFDDVAARPNGQVVVLVANGTTVPNQAGRLTDRLRNQGFNTRNPKTSTPQTSSVIYYRPGYGPEAVVVANVLGADTAIAPMPVPDPAIGDTIDLVPVNVLVLVGPDALSSS